MPQKVFITGCGMISAIGDSFKETEKSVHAGKSGIGAITLLETGNRNQLVAGEIKHTDVALAEMAGISFTPGLTRTALLGIIAAKEALQQSQVKDTGTLALISGTTVGGMVATEKYYNDFLTNDTKNDFIESHDCGDSTERIAGFFGMKGYLSTINTACSSSANAIMLATRLIKSGRIQRAIAGGVDALSKFTLNGFNTLMIIDPNPCKPFDENRNGLNLGEGAAFLVLESEDVIGKKEFFCEISGYGNANDAYHQTALSPDGRGAFLSMRAALEKARLDSGEIDYINAHGTATQNNDLSEGIAIERLFGSKIPFVSSTKPMTGHLLGAAGAVEAVISIIAMKNGCVPANLNFTSKMKELGFSPVTEMVRNVEIRHIMSNSFGFGGNNTTLIFSKA